MRILLGLIVTAAIAYGVLRYKKSEEPAAAPVATAKAQVAQPAASPREVSEHNWAKRSLDRAAEVKRQVAAQQKENGTR